MPAFLIRLKFLGYRCKSGIAIIAWVVTRNNAYSLFKKFNLLNVWCRVKEELSEEEKEKKMKKFVQENKKLIKVRSNILNLFVIFQTCI